MKTLTLTIEDALLSGMSFAMLSGAGIVKTNETGDGNKIYVHTTYDGICEQDTVAVGTPKYVVITAAERNNAQLCVTKEAPVYAVTLGSTGAQDNFLSAVKESEIMIKNSLVEDATWEEFTGTYATAHHGIIEGKYDVKFLLGIGGTQEETTFPLNPGTAVRIDCYTMHNENAYELQIDAENFAGYYQVEASTLFRDDETGSDMPAQIVVPRAKIQSNFTFTMASSGDPSTFTFTIDAFPAYTRFNKKKKVLATLQVLEDEVSGHNYQDKSVIGHKDRSSDADIDSDDYYTQSVFK